MSLRVKAFEVFDAKNAEDPNVIMVEGEPQPKELVLARRLTESVLSLNAEASESLLLASRCQHIGRWQVPRSTEPMGRDGYLRWRAGLKKFHAEKSGEILRKVGYNDSVIDRVESLNLKRNFKSDPECQMLEDALCLVFLKYQFDALIENTDQEKMVRIVKKTWAKMSVAGHEVALKISYSSEGRAVLAEALA